MGVAPGLDIVFTPLILPAAAASLLLAVAGIMDLLWREIEPAYWYISLKIVLLTVAASLYLQGGVPAAPSKVTLQLGFTLLLVAVSILLYKMCMLGGSDVAAFTLIALASPYSPSLPIPPLAASLLAATPPAVAYIILSYARLRLNRGVVTPEDLAFNPRFKWWIPSARGEAVEKLFQGCRLDADPPALAALGGGRVRAEPGIPLVAFIALGYLAYIVAEVLAA
ncbi:hypothetical protein [Aeropyrum camini]|uniref:Uncharacterized protein n=1 Tax=Aeropyrum camini SY1 = JCM 12091 TaxID=1198449 RepID=U3TC83_9CREN|nr:hypothetical protein [Aeropyrum camini]BAN89563.1 hypothetical protein ACAM_0094 [Aeropyrum camini SY1 = JCM 12091]